MYIAQSTTVSSFASELSLDSEFPLDLWVCASYALASLDF